MAGLSATTLGPLDPDDASVAADGWFPAIPLALVRETARLGDGDLSTQRLTASIEAAMLTAFRQLADWRTAHTTTGADSLASVTAQTLNGRNVAVALWERLIVSLTAADLFAGNRDISATDRGLDRAGDKEDGADEYYRRAWAAVADLRSYGPGGTTAPSPRNRVELI
ncbi:head completion/stabilization protein [Novosphingobium sp. SL115]|uniref:head completion/stabilization protein n=1 Tax=Novosphingobium sp. SL115 TaxID=2995150 RepID=UPI002272F6DC|nr:head completion/stabilization protein [Novosphingobium sp. SL115]MCY1672107.1 head completion/stabilization protein [Novosphingobium sp. SL115]